MPKKQTTKLIGKKTPMEVEAQRQRWTAAAIARRRERRNNDPKYAEQHRETSRDYFRRKHGVDVSDFRDCRKNVDRFDDIGTARTIDGEEFNTFNLTELAAALGDYHQNIMRRWIDRNQIPAPALETEDGSEVYLEAEVLAIVEHLGPHQANSAYFRSDHDEVIAGIATAVEDVRQELGIS